MTESHLYPGFRFAGALPSVLKQRRIQAQMLRALCPRQLLVVGCAQGDELSDLLSEINLDNADLTVTATDVCDVEEVLRSHRYAISLGARLHWMQLDLLEAERVSGYGSFDVVQCGFVLHDICPETKDRALEVMSGAVKPGGHLIISEICLKEGSDPASEAIEIYDVFLKEADEARRTNLLQPHEWSRLVGDGESPGLLRTKREAMEGERDFFETRSELIRRAERAALEVRETVVNEVNPRLTVLLLRQAENATLCGRSPR